MLLQAPCQEEFQVSVKVHDQSTSLIHIHKNNFWNGFIPTLSSGHKFRKWKYAQNNELICNLMLIIPVYPTACLSPLNLLLPLTRRVSFLKGRCALGHILTALWGWQGQRRLQQECGSGHSPQVACRGSRKKNNTHSHTIELVFMSCGVN